MSADPVGNQFQSLCTEVTIELQKRLKAAQEYLNSSKKGGTPYVQSLVAENRRNFNKQNEQHPERSFLTLPTTGKESHYKNPSKDFDKISTISSRSIILLSCNVLEIPGYMLDGMELIADRLHAQIRKIVKYFTIKAKVESISLLYFFLVKWCFT